MSHSSQRPSEPAYYIEDCRISGGILHWLWTPASKHEIGLKNLMPSGALNKKNCVWTTCLTQKSSSLFCCCLKFFSTIWLSINQSYFLMFWSWDVWHAMGTLDIFLCQFSVKWNKGGLLRLKSETTFLLSNLQKLTTKFHLIVLQIILGLNNFFKSRVFLVTQLFFWRFSVNCLLIFWFWSFLQD